LRLPAVVAAVLRIIATLFSSATFSQRSKMQSPFYFDRHVFWLQRFIDRICGPLVLGYEISLTIPVS
jgi:hypothetical protein